MKIDNLLKPVGSAGAIDARMRTLSAANGPSPPGDKVQLSSLSASLQKAESALNASPVVNRARVEEIRQAISEGRFQVDANRIADGLVDSVRQLLDSQSRTH